MHVEREKVNSALEYNLAKYAATPADVQKLIKVCYEKYGIPFFRAKTVVALEASPEELNDAEVFWFMDSLFEAFELNKAKLSTWFSDIEVKEYSKLRYLVNEVTFPLRLRMTKVNEDQWNGAIDVGTLLAWRNSIVRYNANIQRRLRTIVRGGVTYEKIMLNTKSVREMYTAFKEGKFIPNPITLNIPVEEMDFYYDEETCYLVINSLDHFDLTDGYHRLVALSILKEDDPQFDYRMEMRITNFTEDKAAQFIKQEELRTPIPKEDLGSYDMYDYVNKVTIQINQSAACNFAGSIAKNGGRINFSVFTNMLRDCFAKDLKEKDRANELLRTVPKDFISSLNALAEEEPTLLDKKLNNAEIRAMVYACYKCFGVTDKSRVAKIYRHILGNVDEKEMKVLTSSTNSNKILKLLEGKVKDV